MKEVSAVAPIRNGKILCGKRRDNQKWTQPGGHLNKDEDPVVGARRELREETGIDMPESSFVHTETKVIDIGEGKKLKVHGYICEIPEGKNPSMKDDPDQEVYRWYWMDLPLSKKIMDEHHVPWKNNVTLPYLMEKNAFFTGFNKEAARRVETPQSGEKWLSYGAIGAGAGLVTGAAVGYGAGQALGRVAASPFFLFSKNRGRILNEVGHLVGKKMTPRSAIVGAVTGGLLGSSIGYIKDNRKEKTASISDGKLTDINDWVLKLKTQGHGEELKMVAPKIKPSSVAVGGKKVISLDALKRQLQYVEGLGIYSKEQLCAIKNSLLKKYNIVMPMAKFAEEKIEGGKADGLKPSDFDPEFLRAGTKVEMEHTGNREIAREIAMDHGAETGKVKSDGKIHSKYYNKNFFDAFEEKVRANS